MSLPQITQLQLDTTAEETSQPRGKSFLFDFTTGQFPLQNGKLVKVIGIDALKIWIEKILRTAKDRFPVYQGTGYGSNLDDLIGSALPFDFVKEELKREITEALLQNKEIKSVTNFQYDRNGSGMTVNFTVNSIYGPVEQEVSY